MSVSGSRAAGDFNLEEFERRLRAAGSSPAVAEDPLLELARLVESAKSEPPVRTVAEPTKAARLGVLEQGTLRPALEDAEFHEETAASEEALEAPRPDEYEVADHALMERPAKGRAFGWTARISALAVAGVAMIGAVLALKGAVHVPGMPRQAPFIAAAQGPVKVAPPSDEAVSAPSEAGVSLSKDNTQSARVKVVASQEQPVDLNALASTAPSAPATTAPVAADASGGTAVQGTVDTPVVVAAPAPPPAPPSQFPDPKPVRTVSLRPDGTLIPTQVATTADASQAAQAADSSQAAPPAEPPKPPAKLAPKAASDAAAAQPSTPRLELPTKLSGKSSARVAVAKTDTTAPASIAEAANEPLQLGPKPTRTGKGSKVQVAAAEPEAPSAPAQTVDSVPATKSSGWVVQFAAPSSEAQANSEMDRLNAKYASALNGSTIGVHKATVKGGTIYRLRVVDLSKADAAALCARVKGDGGSCFIAR
jgi:SPOR domain